MFAQTSNLTNHLGGSFHVHGTKFIFENGEESSFGDGKGLKFEFFPTDNYSIELNGDGSSFRGAYGDASAEYGLSSTTLQVNYYFSNEAVFVPYITAGVGHRELKILELADDHYQGVPLSELGTSKYGYVLGAGGRLGNRAFLKAGFEYANFGFGDKAFYTEFYVAAGYLWSIRKRQ
jgi:hypothetical protein